jgi:hypothetical protein
LYTHTHTKYHVRQLSGKETKGAPKVTGFLLHNASGVGIGGIIGLRKLGLRGWVMKWHCFEK